jgi:hypothetical protein
MPLSSFLKDGMRGQKNASSCQLLQGLLQLQELLSAGGYSLPRAAHKWLKDVQVKGQKILLL